VTGRSGGGAGCSRLPVAAEGGGGSRIARALFATAALALLVVVAGACNAQGVERLVPEVVRALPHDPDAFTQGLVHAEGRFYESTGRYGRSDLREVDLESGT
jgi:glutamine cyclotransferase